ncbi:ABC transporter substrate-binding protein [Planococcus salinarum]|uniref:ABC transporter substrate-binding protein n=1 Tax=Planococcus salinarum TaxID=622695 RepID=UPI000E3D84FE|nr:ABC transporter substrate-binding protein [Planococcus salinarum]TAA70499.1 hypothetical protein D2909_11285 [Planococcus salinarum]
MNRLLLKLWRRLREGEVKQEEIAQILELSQRQTKRWLERWAEEKWLVYLPGTGRGRKTKIHWLNDVEKAFEKEFLQLLVKEPLPSVIHYLDWEWSENARRRLSKQVTEKFGYQPVSDHRFIFPMKYPFLTFNPLKAIDLNSIHICDNLYSRLFSVNEAGLIRGEVAHSWDFTDNKLSIFLKKHVKFHDGSILNSTDVKTCLELFFSDAHYRSVTPQISTVHTPHPLVVEIELSTPCSYLLHLLSMTQASIYKMKNQDILGTGPFYMDYSDNKVTRIKAHDDFYQERPYIDTIDFIKVNSDAELIFRTNARDTLNDAQKIKSESGSGILVFNLFQDSGIQNKEVREYIHSLIRKKIGLILNIIKNSTENNRGCLLNESLPYIVPKSETLKLAQPLVLAASKFTLKLAEQVKKVLEDGGIQVNLLILEHEEYVSIKCSELEADLFISREHFSLDQNLSFYLYFKAGYSQISDLMEMNEVVAQTLSVYPETPVENWLPLHLKIENEVFSNSWMVPLYFNQRHIPYPPEMMGIKTTNYGYADYAKIWIKPSY